MSGLVLVRYPGEENGNTLAAELRSGETPGAVDASFTLTNTGALAGGERVQLELPARAFAEGCIRLTAQRHPSIRTR